MARNLCGLAGRCDAPKLAQRRKLALFEGSAIA
jgi:hypothetical protein